MCGPSNSCCVLAAIVSLCCATVAKPSWAINFPHKNRLSCAYALLGSRLNSVIAPVYEKKISRRETPYLYDHVVFGQVVFPGAGFVDVALSAAIENLPEGSNLSVVKLTNLLITNPLLMAAPLKQERPDVFLQTNLTVGKRIQDAFHLNIHSFSNGEKKSAHHVSIEEGQYAKKWNVVAIPEVYATEFPHRLNIEDLYQWFADCGLHYGPEFRNLVSGGINGFASQGFIKVSEDPRPDTFAVPPSVLDAAFHAVLAIVRDQILFSPEGKDVRSSKIVFVPLDFGEIWFNRAAKLSPGSFAMVRAEIKNTTRIWESFALTYRLQIYNNVGEPILAIENGRLAAAASELH